MILCLSDIHLGSPICQADLTLEILEKEKYDKLIICGGFVGQLSYTSFMQKTIEE